MDILFTLLALTIYLFVGTFRSLTKCSHRLFSHFSLDPGFGMLDPGRSWDKVGRRCRHLYDIQGFHTHLLERGLGQWFKRLTMALCQDRLCIHISAYPYVYAYSHECAHDDFMYICIYTCICIYTSMMCVNIYIYMYIYMYMYIHLYILMQNTSDGFPIFCSVGFGPPPDGRK